VNRNDKVTADIPVVLEGLGESPAERAGLVILTTVEALTVKAIPGDLPDSLTASVKDLAEAGQHITVGDITAPKGVEIDADAEVVIASVYEPGALQAANEAAGGEAEEAATEEDADSEVVEEAKDKK